MKEDRLQPRVTVENETWEFDLHEDQKHVSSRKMSGLRVKRDNGKLGCCGMEREDWSAMSDNGERGNEWKQQLTPDVILANVEAGFAGVVTVHLAHSV